MKPTTAIALLAALLVAASTSNADYTGRSVCGVPPTENALFAWKSKHGKWFACGPIQCTWTAADTEDQAMNYVYNDDPDYGDGSPVYVCDVTIKSSGTTGQARFYRLGTEREGGDYSWAERIVSTPW